MTPTRWLITIFWIFVGGMLIWQFSSFNHRMDRQTIEHPTQQQYFYYNTNINASAAPPAPARADGPDIQQVGFTTSVNKPSPGMFTAYVTIKNKGNAKASGIRVQVRPYKGTYSGDPDGGDLGGPPVHILDDNDPNSLISQWITFPDLGPGQTASGTAVFVETTSFGHGSNKDPQIVFSAEKPKP